MKKMIVLVLSVLLLTPIFCLAAQNEPLFICGKIKKTMTYKNHAKNINYRYIVVEEYDTFNDGLSAYDRQLPYGLYMFRVAPSVESLGDCFEIDIQKNIVTSSTVGD